MQHNHFATNFAVTHYYSRPCSVLRHRKWQNCECPSTISPLLVSRIVPHAVYSLHSLYTLYKTSFPLISVTRFSFYFHSNTFNVLLTQSVMAATLEAIDKFVLGLVQSLDTCYYDFIIEDTPKDTTDFTRTHTLLFPTGTYAARLWQPGDDICLVFMTSNSPRIFWDMALEKLGLDESGIRQMNHQIELPGSVLAQHLSQFELCGTKVYLHYCPFPQNFDIDLIEHYGLPSIAQSGSKTPSEVENLRLVQQAWSRYRTRADASQAGSLSLFEQAYKRIRSWSIAVGIYAPLPGYLNSESLLSMTMTLFTDWQAVKTTTEQSFEEHFLAESGGINSTPESTKQDLTLENKVAILHAFEKAKSRMPSTDILDITPQEGFHQFLSDKSYSFIRMDASCWAQSISKRAKFSQSLPAILQGLAKNIRSSTIQDGLAARIWPWPIEESEAGIETYIIGIQHRDGRNEQLNSNNLDALVGSLADTIEYNRETAYISLASTQKEDLLALSAPHVKFYVSGDTTDDKREDEAEFETTGSESTKFRTASSALSRLRFDPAHINVEYEVGYIDRFDGIKWMSLDHWGRKATEEEDFIPMHRVQILRRLRDGKEVWNREARLDLTGRGA